MCKERFNAVRRKADLRMRGVGETVEVGEEWLWTREEQMRIFKSFPTPIIFRFFRDFRCYGMVVYGPTYGVKGFRSSITIMLFVAGGGFAR